MCCYNAASHPSPSGTAALLSQMLYSITGSFLTNCLFTTFMGINLKLKKNLLYMYSTYQFRENTRHTHKHSSPKAKALFHWILERWEIKGEKSK